MNRHLRLILLLLLSANEGISAQTIADWEWMDKHFELALDSLMPLHENSGFYIAYRAHRDLHTDVPEEWFTIGYERNADGRGLQQTLSAHVIAPDSSSIYTQLMRLHLNNTNEDAASMIKEIKLKRWDSNERDCPIIRKEVETFKELKTNLLDLRPDHIILHPMIHEFRVEAPDGNINVAVWSDDHPLVRWAGEAREALESCTKAH